jgi:hypothetical protein
MPGGSPVSNIHPSVCCFILDAEQTSSSRESYSSFGYGLSMLMNTHSTYLLFRGYNNKKKKDPSSIKDPFLYTAEL